MSNNDELSFEEVVAKYPDVPSPVIRKIDTIVRGGAVLTERALERAREANALFEEVGECGERTTQRILGGAVLRDGTALCYLEAGTGGLHRKGAQLLHGEPYTLDDIDGKLQLIDGDEPIEEVYFVPIPEYYGKTTSRGTPMHQVVSAGPPDCLNISVYSYCHFWEEKQPCRYCYGYGFAGRGKNGGHKTEAELEDIYETVSEALKEPGRWTGLRLSSGSDPTGSVPYENEANEYIRVLKTVGRCFGSIRMPVRLVASAFPEEQLIRLAEAGVTSSEPHLEVWDEKLFDWICPGKAKWFGRQYWIDSAIAAVKILGRGNVCSQFVGGAEMAQPFGFKTTDEAVASTLEGAEFLAQHGVTTTVNLLTLRQGSIFTKERQARPSLEYAVKLVSGLSDIRRKHRLGVDFNDYRRCALHPDADLSRLDYPDVEIAEPNRLDYQNVVLAQPV